MEDWYSAYSEPCGSDVSSEYGYVTASEDVAGRGSSPNLSCRRSFGRSVSQIEEDEIEPQCQLTLYDTNVTSERTDQTDILHMLYMVNDCIWCTNLFVKERKLEGKAKRRGFCSKRRGFFYSTDDANKELHYIDFILEKLLNNVLPLAETLDPSLKGKSDLGIELLLRNNISENGKKNDVFANGKHGGLSEKFDHRNGKEKEMDKPLANGTVSHKGEKVLFRNDNREVEPVTVILPSTEGDDVQSEEVEKMLYDNNSEGQKDNKIPANGISVIYMFPGKDNLGGIENGDAGGYFPHPSVSVSTLNEISWTVDLYKKQMQINEKIGLANALLEIISDDGQLDECVKSMNEYLIRKRSEIPEDMELTKYSTKRCPSVKSCNPFKVTSVDSLLFDKEKWRVEAVQRNGGDPLEHLCGIALPLEYDSFKNDTRATYYGIKRKNLLSISLQTADMSEDIQNTQFKKIFSFFMLLLSISLYFSDLVSDLILAGDHFTNGNTQYASLTLTFVIAPLMADTLSKLILKMLGWDKEYGKLKWKDVFNFNDFKIVKWMASSVKYAYNSMKDYQTYAPCYAQLHSYRCNKGKKECSFSDAKVKVDSNHICTVFSSMLAWNERFTLQTKLAESLNEAAPQLLLQLTIVIKQFISGDDIGLTSWISIVTSILSLSWSLHLSHFNRHYHTGGRVLNNSYEWSGRIMEFIGNCFVYGSRLTSICLVTSVLGVWAIVGALVYLTAIYFVMITFSGRKEIYKTLHRYKTTIFWPLHRLFTVPYRIGIWRMDSVDHLIFYLETICLALSLPFLLPADVNLTSRWIVTGCVLSFEAIGIALLYIFKRFFHPYGYVCENR